LIRPAEPRDFPAIAELTNHYIRTTAIHFAHEDVSAQELLEQWAAGRDVYPWLVAATERGLAGYAKAGPWRSRTAYQWTPETGIYLRPEEQGQGIGRVLYARLLDVLRAQGFRSVIGGITLPNEASVALHEKLGFLHVGTVREAGCKSGRWHDVGFWQLRLREDASTGGPLRKPTEAWNQSAALTDARR
jgi:phosphinothricin acetyltransferase